MNMAEARWLAKHRLHEHNEERPYSSLGCQAPSEFASQCAAESLSIEPEITVVIPAQAGIQ